jgi:hypothetical protein
MAEPCFRFPVVCPECGQEEISELQIAGVAAALLKGDVIQLYASCHDIYWNARAVEVGQIREYLALAGVSVRRVTAPNFRNAPDIASAGVAPEAGKPSDDGRKHTAVRRHPV